MRYLRWPDDFFPVVMMMTKKKDDTISVVVTLARVATPYIPVALIDCVYVFFFTRGEELGEIRLKRSAHSYFYKKQNR